MAFRNHAISLALAVPCASAVGLLGVFSDQGKPAPPGLQTTRLVALRVVQDSTDQIVSADNKQLDRIEALSAGAKALKAAKPSSATVDAIVGLKDAMGAAAADAFTPWQRYGVGGKGDRSKPPRLSPKAILLAQLQAQRKGLAQKMDELEAVAKGHQAPDEVRAAFLACVGRLDDAIKRVERIESADLAKDARDAAFGAYVAIVRVTKDARGGLEKAAREAKAADGEPVPLGKAVQDSRGPLDYAARVAEVDGALPPNVVKGLKGMAPSDPPFEEYKPQAKELSELARTALVAFSEESRAFEEALAREAADAGDLLRAALADPRGNALEAHAAAKTLAQRMKAAGETQKILANLADALAAKPLANLVPKPSDAEFDAALAALVASARATGLGVARLEVVQAELVADHPDDMSAWTEAEVNLYYFDDVERLLGMITPNVEKKRDEGRAGEYQASQTDLLRSQEELVTARARLDDARRRLLNAQEDLRLEQARVVAEKSRLGGVRDEAAKGGDAATQEVRARQLEVDEAQVTVNDATRAATRAKDALDRNTDATKKDALQAAYDQAVRDRDEAQTQLERRQNLLRKAQAEQAAAADKATAAGTNLANLQSAVAALQTKLAEAETAEGGKLEALRTASTKVLVDAFLANRKFAAAVDGSPYLVTKRLGFTELLKTSTDPADRVLLYGEPMEKRIVIRGRAPDVETVRRLIALLDRPQSQTEITVFSADISSPTGKLEAARTRDALRILDVTLARYSGYNDASQTLLRQCIAGVVQDYSADLASATRLADDRPTGARRTVPGESRTDRTPLWQAVAKLLGELRPILPRDGEGNLLDASGAWKRWDVPDEQIEEAADWVFAQPERLRSTILSLDPRVLEAVDVAGAVRAKTDDFLNQLPDLGSPASLGEATLALALLRPELRDRALALYEARIVGRFKERQTALDLDKKVFSGFAPPVAFSPTSYFGAFRVEAAKGEAAKDDRGSRKEMGEDGTTIQRKSLGGASLIAPDVKLLQDGFAYVYTAQNRPTVLRRLDRLRTEATKLALEVGKGVSDLKAKLKGLEDEKQKLRGEKEKEKEEATVRTEGMARISAMLDGLTEKQEQMLRALIEAGIRFNQPIGRGTQESLRPVPFVALLAGGDLLDDRVSQRLIDAGLNWLDDYDAAVIAFRRKIESVVYGGPDYHRNVARYNMALRRVMGLYYADVQNDLVNGDRGLVVAIGKILNWSKAEVGAWNTETILASNRLAARLDPQATASAQQSGTIDAAGGALVLANLMAAGATQNAPAALKGLKDLAGTQRKEAPAVYGIGTGNVFEVIPIADPTGQALRMRFNYVASTRVREPGNVTDRQLNNVERTSVNTEVVLDNLAIKRVGRFQSNVTTGLPAQKDGGFPIFKDLPFFKEIPIIGWFSYRIGGRRPVVQQSLVLTQAAIYPTIEDVVGSLSVSYRQGG